MPETIGQQLKAARTTRNLTFEKVTQATHIQVHLLQAMEADDFESLPSPVQARAFLRLYAGYLGLSATLATDRVFQAFLGDGQDRAFMHGPTFMGNALACAVALASIGIFERDRTLDKIRRIEEILREELLSLCAPTLRETRVFGACGVIEVHHPSAWLGIQAFAAERGVWLRPFDKVVYTMPAYVIDEASLRKVCQTMRAWFTRA